MNFFTDTFWGQFILVWACLTILEVVSFVGKAVALRIKGEK